VKLKFDRSEPGVWVSGAAHVALIGAGLVAFATAPFPEAAEGIPVEVISESQLAQITRGEKTAAEVKLEAKPRAERLAEKVEEKDPGEQTRDAPAPPKRPAEMKVDDKPVEVAAPAPMPPVRPDPPKPEPRPEPVRQAEPKPAPEKTPEPPKREDLAKLLEREDAELRAKAAAETKAKEEAKAKADAEAERQKQLAAEKARQAAEAKRVADAKAKAEAEARAKRQAELAEKFDPSGIASLLKSKEPAQASGSTGREINRTASLGTATGNAPKLSPHQLSGLVDALQSQIRSCYLAPPGAAVEGVVRPVLDIRLNVDGSLSGEPKIVSAGPKPVDRSVAEAALRAVRRCAPYRLPAQFAPYYNDWKNLKAEFDLPQA
jgi:colicin import membrane protein